MSWKADRPKDLDLQLKIGNDCRIFTNQRNCSGARLDTDWKQGGSEAGDGGVETVTISIKKICRGINIFHHRRMAAAAFCF